MPDKFRNKRKAEKQAKGAHKHDHATDHGHHGGMGSDYSEADHTARGEMGGEYAEGHGEHD